MNTNTSANTLRITLCMVISMAVFFGLIGRLYVIQVVNAPDVVAKSQKTRNVEIHYPPTRGKILDRTMRPLAVNEWKYIVKADKSAIDDIHDTVTQVGRALGMSERAIQDDIDMLSRPDIKAIEVRRKVTEEEKVFIESLEIPGIFFEKQDSRFYAEGNLASQLIGYTNVDNRGAEGLEFSLDYRLVGQKQVKTMPADVRRRQMFTGEISEPETSGLDAVLTIDSYIQHVVERELEGVLDRTKALYANAVVLSARTGEILAMANAPGFDPNRYSEYSPELHTNRVVNYLYEPGSVMKPFTFAAALEAGVVTPYTPIDCENGAYYIYGHTINDDIHEYGILSVHDVMVFSSNIGTIKIAQMLTENDRNFRDQMEQVYEAMRAFGFKDAERGMQEFPGDRGGQLRPEGQDKRWYPHHVRSIPFGQAMKTNTLWLTSAYAAIATRGLVHQPKIVKGYRAPDGVYIPLDSKPPHRIMEASVLEPLVDMLVDVTEHPEGTGRRIRIPGYPIAGKTGTAQKYDPEARTYGRGMRIATFSGFFPANDPEIVMTVMVDEPKIGKYGGEVAGPAWKAIAEEIIAYWGMTPTNPNDPLLHADGETEAQEVSLDNTYGLGGRLAVRDWSPSMQEVEKDVMPDLTGLSRRDAMIVLHRLGLTAQFEGAGVVIEQERKPGTSLGQQDDVGTVRCAPVIQRPEDSDGSRFVVQG